MKKLIALFLACMVLFGMAYASEIDLTGMSFDELVALKDQINLAIWNSEEWQEVTVPQGKWIVGDDIPAGTWIVKCADVNRKSYMMKECDITITSGNDWNWLIVYNPEHEDYDAGKVTELRLDLKKGDIVEVSESYAPAVFTPNTGKPSLGFK